MIYIEAGGADLQHWNLARLSVAGPGGRTAWDRLPGLAVYDAGCSDLPMGTTASHHAMLATGVELPSGALGFDAPARVNRRKIHRPDGFAHIEPEGLRRTDQTGKIAGHLEKQMS